MGQKQTMVVQGGANRQVEQGPDYRPGISAETVGAKALWLGLVTIAPGQRTKAHIHPAHESAFYMLSGDTIELHWGPALEHCALAVPGDFLYVPAGMLHVAVNRSATPAVFIGSRNDPTAVESLVLRPEMDAKVS